MEKGLDLTIYMKTHFDSSASFFTYFSLISRFQGIPVSN